MSLCQLSHKKKGMHHGKRANLYKAQSCGHIHNSRKDEEADGGNNCVIMSMQYMA